MCLTKSKLVLRDCQKLVWSKMQSVTKVRSTSFLQIILIHVVKVYFYPKLRGFHAQASISVDLFVFHHLLSAQYNFKI